MAFWHVLVIIVTCLIWWLQKMKDTSQPSVRKLTSTFCNPSVFRCIDYFVLLPKSPKVTLARRSSFAPTLWRRIQRALKKGTSVVEATRSELIYPDYVGRLAEKSPNGNGSCSRWCVLSDLLFCVFDNELCDKASIAIILPGHSVKSLIFRTASICTIGKSNRLSKTLDDLDMFQFVIENDNHGQKYKFSTSTQQELDKWVSLLKIACCLDPDIGTLESTLSGKISGKTTLAVVPSECYGDLSDSALHGNSIGHSGNSLKLPRARKSRRDSSDYYGDDSSEYSCEVASSPEVNQGVRRAALNHTSADDVFTNEGKTIIRFRDQVKHVCSDGDSDDDIKTVLFSRRNAKPPLSQPNANKRSKLRSGQAADSATSSNLNNTQARDMDITDYLYYKGMAGWGKVYCVLKDRGYFMYKTSDISEAPTVFIDLRGCCVTLVDDEKQVGSAFKIMLPTGFQFCFAPPNNLDMERWLSVLRNNGCEITEDTSVGCSQEVDCKLTPASSAVYWELTHAVPVLESQSVEAYCTTPRRRSREAKVDGQSLTVYPQKSPDVTFANESVITQSPATVTVNGRFVPPLRERSTSGMSSVSCQSAPPVQCDITDKEEKRVLLDVQGRVLLRSTSCSPPRERKPAGFHLSRSMDNFDGAEGDDTRDKRSTWDQEILALKRDQLLKEVLRQKAELEAKQGRLEDSQLTEHDINIKYERAQTEEERKTLRDLTQLRQRRVSTLLRVETVQKQLEQSQLRIKSSKLVSKPSKRSKVFRSKIAQTGSTEELQQKLNELTNELDKIDSIMSQKEEQKLQTVQRLSSERVQELQKFSSSVKKRNQAALQVNQPDILPLPVKDDNSSLSSAINSPVQSPALNQRSKKKSHPLKFVSNITDFRFRGSKKKSLKNKQNADVAPNNSENVMPVDSMAVMAVETTPKTSTDVVDFANHGMTTVSDYPPSSVEKQKSLNEQIMDEFKNLGSVPEKITLTDTKHTGSFINEDDETEKSISLKGINSETVTIIEDFEMFIKECLQMTDTNPMDNIAV